MDNTPPPPSGGQPNQPPDNTPQSAETERIIIEPSSTPEYTPPAGQPYTGQPEYTSQPEQMAPPQNYPPAQPTVPMGGPPQGYQPQGYAPPPSTPQYQQPYPPAQTTVTQKKGGMPGWAMVLIGLFVALLLACGLGYWLLMRAADEAGKALTGASDTIGASFAVLGFDIALATNDYEGAHDYLGGDLANRYSVADLEQRWEALSSNGSVTTEPSDVRMSGGRPQVVWSLTPSGGTKKEVTLTLEQSGDDWKIVEANPDLIPSP